ncbi:MAG: TIGR01777 family protein [Gemmatimonas sp.]|nr:TIGR01777 family protein [Gemmatimonas sp.]
MAISGASGFIGSALSRLLEGDGWKVRRIVRRKPSGDEIEWRPTERWIDREALEGVDAVVHLAGESIFGVWTQSKKRRILESRTHGTRTIAEALTGLERPPQVLVSVSGVNYYGDAGDRTLREDDPAGTDFLARVCVAWEAAAQPAADAGIRVVHPRFGLVLDPAGGSLRLMLPFFRMGIGGRLGSGKQWMSWISRRDATRVIRSVMTTPSLEGPVNAVAPEPVRNEDFTRALADAVQRPAFLAVPDFVLRTFSWGMGETILLASQRAIPAALLDRGFSFEYPTIRSTLAAGLD